LIPFRARPLDGVLLLATDGLLKYTSRERICETVRTLPFHHVPEALINLVRSLGSGTVGDDVAIALCRSLGPGASTIAP